MNEEQARFRARLQEDLVFRIEMEEDGFLVEDFVFDLLERSQLKDVDLAKAIQTVKSRRDSHAKVFGPSKEKKDFAEGEEIRLDDFIRAIVNGRFRGKTPTDMLNSPKSQLNPGWALAAANDRVLADHPNLSTYTQKKDKEKPSFSENPAVETSNPDASSRLEAVHSIPEPIRAPKTLMDWAKQPSYSSTKVEKEQPVIQRTSFRMR